MNSDSCFILPHSYIFAEISADSLSQRLIICAYIALQKFLHYTHCCYFKDSGIADLPQNELVFAEVSALHLLLCSDFMLLLERLGYCRPSTESELVYILINVFADISALIQ